VQYDPFVTPTVTEDTVYVGGGNWQFFALQRDPMIQGWHFDTTGALSSPAVVDDTVYVGSDDGHLYALSPPGEDNDEYQPEATVEWAFEPEGDRSPSAGGTSISSPAVVGDTVYVNTFNDLYALDRADGSVRWSANAGAGVPAVANGSVYLTANGQVEARSATDGTVEWRSGNGGTEAVAVADGDIFVAQGALRKLHPADGSVIWEVDPGSDSDSDSDTFGFSPSSPPVVASGTVYAGLPNTMYAVDAASGSVHWTYETDDAYVQTPAVADGELYFTSTPVSMEGSAGATLHALTEP
jgi:outer membrane protein assembly factor BamB